VANQWTIILNVMSVSIYLRTYQIIHHEKNEGFVSMRLFVLIDFVGNFEFKMNLYIFHDVVNNYIANFENN